MKEEALKTLEAIDSGMLDLSDIMPYLDPIKIGLKKMIPMSVCIRHSVKYGDKYNDGFCPQCSTYVSDDISWSDQNYCINCGQKLKWD